MTDSHPKVFISSTLEDLPEFRKKAVEAVIRRGMFPIDCGYWAAEGNPPLETCLEKVDEADVLICIVAHRHGWTPPGQEANGHKSITRLECERAHGHRKIKVIPFLVDDAAPWDGKLYETYRLHEAPPENIAAVASEVARNVTALREFQAWLNSISTRRLFSTPDQLGTEVLQALVEWGKDHGHGEASASKASIRAGYLDWLRRSCESVELLGLNAEESQNVRLGQVYVPAVTPKRPESWSAADIAQTTEREREQWPDLLLHRLGETSLYVPGAPGAGKSTFCRWLALAVAGGSLPAHPVATPEGFAEQLPASLNGRFPLLCRLREWAGHGACLAGNGHWTGAQLEHALTAWLTTAQPGGLTPDVLREELAHGRCLLIFDGVDEVPETFDSHYPRRNFLSGLADALPDWLAAGNRVLLTSRPYGLSGDDLRRIDLPLAELAELPPPLQDTFVRRWYAAADPPRATEKAEGLLSHLQERRDLDELRGNPMLLTALCVKYDEGRRLPRDFYRLYDSLVNQVLYKRYLTDIERDAARRRLAAVALGMHRGDVSRPRATPAAEVSHDEVERLLAELAQTDRTTESGAAGAATMREDLLSNSGLLLPRAEQRAAFYHLSFQEFLAALRLRRLGVAPEKTLAQYAGTAHWRRTLTFLFCAIADQDSPEAAVAGFAPLIEALAPERLTENPNPALLLADCLEIAHARGWNLAHFAAPLLAACQFALTQLEPPLRAQLWQTLGQLELDQRPGVGVRRADSLDLPHFDWVEIPAGEFRYGEKNKKLSLERYYIARYPVTVRQFRCFTDDPQGYANPEWWEGLAEHPSFPQAPQWNIANHPRENVSWFDAVAYCCWASARLGYEIQLPTEQQWEKAARGQDGREFPWGAFESGHANINETWDNNGTHNLGRSSAAGIYPSGASPYGVLDMAGNVWEWCLNEYERPENTSLAGEVLRVARGGAWSELRHAARCAYRGGLHPGVRLYALGFRVLCVSPIP